MRQKRTNVQQTCGLKSRVRTSFRRSKFVSYSGQGSPKIKVKRSENTPRIPYSYTNKQKWNTFYTNGRPMFHKCCFLLCDVIFEKGSCSFWEESHNQLPGEHAEVKALSEISTKELEADTVARLVRMYLSYSPCANCADFIIGFSTYRPHCQLSVGFSCLFRHEEVRHRDGLRRLNAAPRIFLGVFTDRDWMRLAQATGTPFYYHSPRRQSGDLKWKAEFENILKEQPGTTALRPSVPSQDRDWASVTIQPTHIPQYKGSTAGAATSSLSPGLRPSVLFPETHWASLTFHRTHIPQYQGSTAGAATSSGLPQRLRPSVPSQERDWTSVTIQPTHIPQYQVSTAGAATSRGLSQGPSSRMWWQSRDEQREDLLDARNGAVTSCVKNRRVYCVVLAVVIILIVTATLLSLLL